MNIEAGLRRSSSAHPPLLHCEQRSLRQRKIARLAYDSEHGKLWQDIKAALDKIRARASKFATDAEWAFGKRTARVLGVLTLFAVVVTLLMVFLDWYVAPNKPDERKDLVLTLAQILGGTALLSGLYFTWRTLQVNREGQLTERFTRAIDQLGATDDKTGRPQLELRLGGIYALERIDKESPERAYHRTVMDVLTAYTREDASRDRGEYSRREPPADIQAILNVLNRRQEGGVPKDPVHHLDLRGAYLEGASLVGAALEGANLERSNLRGAALEGAKLQAARLQDADLRGAYLQVANLRGAKVTEEQLAAARSLQGATMPDGSKHP